MVVWLYGQCVCCGCKLIQFHFAGIRWLNRRTGNAKVEPDNNQNMMIMLILITNKDRASAHVITIMTECLHDNLR